MQGTNNSRISMSNQRGSFDDANWGGGKKNTRGAKGKNSQHQEVRQKRKTGTQSKRGEMQNNFSD